MNRHEAIGRIFDAAVTQTEIRCVHHSVQQKDRQRLGYDYYYELYTPVERNGRTIPGTIMRFLPETAQEYLEGKNERAIKLGVIHSNHAIALIEEFWDKRITGKP